MRILAVGENKIEIDLISLFTGKETVYYNGEIVSRKKSMWGCVHSFNVNENGTDTHYEIKTGLVFQSELPLSLPEMANFFSLTKA